MLYLVKSPVDLILLQQCKEMASSVFRVVVLRLALLKTGRLNVLLGNCCHNSPEENEKKKCHTRKKNQGYLVVYVGDKVRRHDDLQTESIMLLRSIFSFRQKVHKL